MAREVQWRRSSMDGQPVWTANVGKYTYYGKFNLKLKIYAGYVGNIGAKNSVLQVIRPIEGKRDGEILFSREFTSSFMAKEVVDSLLYLCFSIIQNKEENAEKWFLQMLKDFHGSEMAKPYETGSAITKPYRWWN